MCPFVRWQHRTTKEQQRLDEGNDSHTALETRKKRLKNLSWVAMKWWLSANNVKFRRTFISPGQAQASDLVYGLFSCQCSRLANGRISSSWMVLMISRCVMVGSSLVPDDLNVPKTPSNASSSRRSNSSSIRPSRCEMGKPVPGVCHFKVETKVSVVRAYDTSVEIRDRRVIVTASTSTFITVL